MNSEEFSKFRHDAVHELMRLNDSCEQEFHISSYPRWDYDFARGTLTFSQDGVPKVVALIQVVGTTAESDGTWLWSWANRSSPPLVTSAMQTVRSFGEAHRVTELVAPNLPCDEYLGWAMTAVTAKILGAVGAYRCPGDRGFLYLVYTKLGSADSMTVTPPTGQVSCAEHGTGNEAFICTHLFSNPAQKWISDEPDEANRWPDAWCVQCEARFQEEGGNWNENNEPQADIKFICHRCYENLRLKGTP